MLKLLLGDPNTRKLKRYQPIVSDVTLLEEEIAPLSDDELRGKTAAFQKRLAIAGSLEKQRPILVQTPGCAHGGGGKCTSVLPSGLPSGLREQLATPLGTRLRVRATAGALARHPVLLVDSALGACVVRPLGELTPATPSDIDALIRELETPGLLPHHGRRRKG